jgi:two-component system chemotaxis sensor kinase CheA
MAAGKQTLWNEFVSEAQEHLATACEDLLALEKYGADEAGQSVDRLFRAMHSVKGGAGLVGCRQIGALAHAMETILDRLRRGQLTLAADVMDGLLAGHDLMHTLLDDIGTSDEVDIAAVLRPLENLLAPPPTAVPVSAPPLARPPLHDRPPGHPFLYALRVELGDYTRRTARLPARFLAELETHGCILDAQLHIPDQDLALGMPEGPVEYECLYSSTLPLAPLTGRLQLLPGEISFRPEASPETPVKQAPPPPVDEEPDSSRGPGPDGVPAGPTEERPSSVRIGVGVLDRLMTLAGELVLVRNQALRAVDAADPQVMRNVVQRLNTITTDVQQAVMLTRMQPVSILFGKFPRLVRDLSKHLGKQIELTLRGTEVELDKTILESLSDPLTHLIRNCCDHGIELPAERIAAGKSPEGHIELHAHHEGGQIRIELYDDGRGIDAQKVRRKALEKGLKTAEELAALSDAEAQALILTPGFSTADRVTELSGRGIGMDVVRTNVEQLRGSLQIESTPGKGTWVHLRLPLTLAIIPCLMVSVGPDRYAIPQKDLEELVCLDGEKAAAKVEYAFGHQVYRLRNRLLRLVWLSEVLGRPRSDPRSSVSFAVVKVGAQRFGLVVDQLLNTEEMVIKPMHPILKPLRCFSGATIMGDGSVALILDIEGIARHAGVFSDTARQPAPAGPVDLADRQTILLFRYGPREQFAVPLDMIRRIEEVPASRIEHVGEREFVTVKGQSVRVLRLDRHLRVSAATEQDPWYLLLPKHLKQPLGILISEIIDTESLLIHLDTQSYQEDGILGTAVVRERMTLFLDLFRLGDRVAGEPEADPGKRLTGSVSGLPASGERTPGPTRRRILVVDDTQFFRHLVKSYLENEGYSVATAVNGALALKEVADQPFDLVVSDIEMPEMDGWRFARAVRDQLGRRELPLLALTTLSSDQDRQRAFECGFDGYEVKLDRERFLASVTKLLERSQGAVAHGGPAHG